MNEYYITKTVNGQFAIFGKDTLGNEYIISRPFSTCEEAEKAKKFISGIKDFKYHTTKIEENKYIVYATYEDNIIMKLTQTFSSEIEAKNKACEIIFNNAKVTNSGKRSTDLAVRDNKYLKVKDKANLAEIIEQNEDNNKFKKFLVGGAIVVVVASGIALIAKGCNEAKDVPTAPITSTDVPSPTPTIAAVKSTPEPTVAPIKEMTHAEKINFIKENAEKFKNEMNSIDNINIDTNDALLELCYINGINPSELNVSCEDVVLTALTIYGNYIDKTFTNAKNYLCYNTELRGQNNIYTDVYSKYICDKSDKEIYAKTINKALEVINGCNTLDKQEVLEISYKYNTILANDTFADENYENCSPEVQTLVLMICYNSPELLPPHMKINIDTPIGIQTLENINEIKENKTSNENYEIKFMNGDESYTNLRNEYSHLYRISTRNATQEYNLSNCNKPLSNKTNYLQRNKYYTAVNTARYTTYNNNNNKSIKKLIRRI